MTENADMAGAAAPVEVIARAVICTPDGVVLARQRGKSWSFLPGGHHESGELLTATLARELEEELGFTPEAPVPVGVVEHSYTEHGERRHELNIVFAVNTTVREFVSREDHLAFHVVPWDQLGRHEVRAGPVSDALAGWAAARAPFLSVLPAAAA